MIRKMLDWWRTGPGRGDVLGINRRNLDLVFADYRPGRFRDLDDKLAAKKLLEQADVSVPRTLAVIKGRSDLVLLDDLLDGVEDFVLKPANGWGGRGILILVREGDRWLRSGREPVAPAAVHDHVEEIMAGIHSLDQESDAAIAEELIRPHPFYAGLGPDGLCDLRIVLEDHRPLQAMCRVPTRASDGKANLHGGGVGLGLDLATGAVVGALCGSRRITRHPDTGQELVGLKLPDWNACVDLAIAASRTVSVRYVGVDIVVDRDRGPLILEVNARPGLAIQIANGQPQIVARRQSQSRWDRATMAATWLILLVLVLSPLAYHWWQQRFSEGLVVDVAANELRSEVVSDDKGEDGEASEAVVANPAQVEEMELAEADARFSSAREAAAAGDTVRAVAIYESLRGDQGLAPFALNNLAVLARRAGQDSLAVQYLHEAVARYPQYQRGLRNLGIVLGDLGRTDEARDAFARALELKPNHAPTWLSLGNLDFDEGRYEAAADAYRKAVRYDPTGTEVRLKLGLALRLVGDLPAAAEVLADLLALDPASEPGAYWLGRTRVELYRAGAPGAEGRLQAAAGLLTMGGGESPRLQSLHAEILYETGELRNARRIFAELAAGIYRPRHHALCLAQTNLDLGNWAAVLAGVEAAASSGATAEARLRYLAEIGAALDEEFRAVPAPDGAPEPIARLLSAVIGGNPRSVVHALAAVEARCAGADQAWARWLAGRSDEESRARALALPGAARPCGSPAPHLDRVLAADGPPPLTLVLAVGREVARRRGDDEAVMAHEAALQKAGPDFVPALRKAFAAAQAQGDEDRAYVLGADLDGLGYDEPYFVLDLAGLERSQGRPQAAGRKLASLPASFRRSPEAIVLRARLDLAEGQGDRAVNELTELVGRSPEFIEAHFALGEAYSAANRWDEALASNRVALDLAPSRTDIRGALARTLMKLGRYPEAVREWQVLLSMDPEDPAFRFNHALSLQRSGDEAAALAAYDALLDRDPERTSALYNRGLALERLDRPAEAAATYRRLLELKPNHRAAARRLADLEGTE